MIPIDPNAPAAQGQQTPDPWWKTPLSDFRDELEWLHSRGTELLEYLTLPVIHVIAAALNFAMILVSSKPVFGIPFKSLAEVLQTREAFSDLAAAHKAGKKAKP